MTFSKHIGHAGVWLTAAVLALASASSVAGVKGSKHDLGAGGAAQGTTTATTEVCVFCHTPHGANTNASAPLWNKTLPTAGSYTRYSALQTSTLTGAEAPVGSVSLACLSCHDGTQAMDVVINKPGSGGYNAAGAELDLAAIGAMTGTPIPNLGPDLRNDHPISIQYAGGGCSTADTACATLGNPDFVTPATGEVNQVRQWWIDTAGGTANKREKTDMILYTRTEGGATQPFVECASCHDPHDNTARPVQFMRISNANSAVCLACHVK